MDDRCDNAAALAPGLTVAREQPVAQKRQQRIAHLRALALELRVVLPKNELNRLRAIAQEYLARKKPYRNEFVFARVLFPYCDHVPPPQLDPLPMARQRRHAVRIRRYELAQTSPRKFPSPMAGLVAEMPRSVMASG